MTSTDHCIITKYDLSEREKEIKKAFFSKKDKNGQTQVQGSSNAKKMSVYNNLPQENEEMINKLIDENFQSKKLPANVNATPQNVNSNIPLNLIYSQNKILERNVDVLHETQRSIHDLLVYNLQKEKNKKSTGSNAEKIQQMQLIQQMISPLYQSIEEMKRSLNHIGSSNSRADTRPSASGLSEKVDDMINMHSNFKESSSKVIKNVERVEKNKQVLKDNAILKAIEDLKTSVGQINSEMAKMENEFGENLKKIVEDREKQNMKNLMGSVHNAVNSVNRSGLAGARSNFQNKKNNVDDLDYVEYKNEILEINQRKEEILSDFQFNKLVIPKVVRPSEKISFSYKLDFEDEENIGRSGGIPYNQSYKKAYNSSKSNNLYHSNKMSNCSMTEGEPRKEKNVFLDNLNSSASMTNQKQNRHTRSLSTSKNVNIQRHNRTRSKENSTGREIYTYNEENKQTNQYEANDDQQNEEEEMDIVEKMKRFQEKMRSLPKNSERDEKANMMSLNINSTKHSVNKSTEPSSAKYLKSPTMFQKEGIKKDLAPVEEKEDHPENDDFVVKQIKTAEKEMETCGSYNENKIRKGITLVEVTPQERNKQNTLEDLIIKLCVEKMLKKEGKPVNTEPYLEVPGGVKENKFPFEFKDMQVKFIAENLFRDRIRNLLRGREKKNAPQLSEQRQVKQANETNATNEMMNIFREENERRDKELANLVSGLMNRFVEMEKSLQERSKDPAVNGKEENIDMEDMVNKITDKIKSNMHININLTQPAAVIRQNNPPPLQMINEQLLIEGVKNPEEEEEEVKSQSGYMNPFQDTRRVNYEEVNRDIPMPHFINMQDYDLSSSSYVTDSKRTLPSPKKAQNRRDHRDHMEESLSEGQVPNSKIYTDQDTSSYLTTPGKRGKTNGIDVRALEKFNQQIQSHLKNFQSLDLNEYLDNTDRNDIVDLTASNRSRSEHNHESLYDGEESSTISINVHKHLVDLNNNNDLKTLNLYDSDEHRLFQKQFGGGESGAESRRIDQNSEFDSQRQNKSEFKFFKTTGKLSQNSNPTMFSFQNVLSNRSEKSASVVMSNRPLYSSGPLDGVKALTSSQGSGKTKFVKVNSEEIENLLARQNSLNDKMKLMSRNANVLTTEKNLNNNTIPENYSDMEVTINQDINTLTQNLNHNNIPDKKKKVYKTDESSSLNGSML